MGNASYRQTTLGNNQTNQQDNVINFMQLDLPKFVKQAMIGNGKFMKSYLMSVDSTQVTVKVYMKLPDEDLQGAISQLISLWKAIPPSKYPNLMPYQMWIKSSSRIKTPASPVYLLRQYFHSNLYDRLSTRPFLDEIEKYWILFQLFKALEICHELNIVHGDLKPENIMCTTSNWIVLSDFGPYKPVTLPDDDPTDFHYYFDSMSRHRCYLAPERFIRNRMIAGNGGSGQDDSSPNSSSSNTPDVSVGNSSANRSSTPLMARFRTHRNTQNGTTLASGQAAAAASRVATPAMDVFALGCVMAEVLLDGTILLDLPSMLQYLSSSAESLGTVHPSEDLSARTYLSRISNPHVRQVIIDMTQKDPEKRLSVSQYLALLQGRPGTGISSEEGSSKGSIDGEGKSALCVFPPFFDTCLYPLYLKLHWQGVTPDDRVHLLCEAFDDIMQNICGSADSLGSSFFNLHLRSASRLLSTAQTVEAVRSGVLLLPALPSVIQGDIPSVPTLPLREDLLKSARATGLKGAAKDPFDEKRRKQPEPLQETVQGSVQDLISRAREQIEAVRQIIASTNTTTPANVTPSQESSVKVDHPMESVLKDYGDIFTMHSENLGLFSSTHLESSDDLTKEQQHAGLVIIVDLLCANYRHLKFLPSRCVALLLLLRMGKRCRSTIILQRILPIVVAALDDSAATVRILALRVITHLLCTVRKSLQNALNKSLVGDQNKNGNKNDWFVQEEGMLTSFFPSYLLPSLGKVVKDPEVSVRACTAQCLGDLVLAARDFLMAAHRANIVRNANSDAANPPSSGLNSGFVNGSSFNFEHKYNVLKELMGRCLRDLILDSTSSVVGAASGYLGSSSSPSLAGSGGMNSSLGNGLSSRTRAVTCADSAVKKALLTSLPALCIFFGQEGCMDKILTQVLTFLSDPDWELRALFCLHIPSVAAFMGSTVMSQYILPCMEQLLLDMEERVCRAYLVATNALIEQELVARPLIVELIERVCPLVVHPSHSIRSIVRRLIGSAAKSMGIVDTAVYLLPHIQKVVSLKDLFPKQIETLYQREKCWKRPLSHPVYVRALLKEFISLHTSEGVLIRQDLLVSSGGSFIQENNLAQMSKEEEEEKLLMLRQYLVKTSKEVRTKGGLWNYLLVGSASGHPTGIQLLGPLSKLNYTRHPLLQIIGKATLNNNEEVYDSVVEVMNVSSGAGMVQSLYVPLTRGCPYISDDMRKRDLYLTTSEIRNRTLIQALYLGSTAQNYDLFRGNTASLVHSSGTDNLEDLSSAPISSTNSAPTPAVVLPLSPAMTCVPPSTFTSASTVAGEGAAGRVASWANTLTRSRPIYSWTNMESIVLLRRLRALRVPPLPVDLGTLGIAGEENGALDGSNGLTSSSAVNDGRVIQSNTINSAAGTIGAVGATGAGGVGGNTSWRPCSGGLIMTLREHIAAVNRISVAADHSYFVSASTDSTVRIWASKNLDRVAFPRSAGVYRGHSVPVIDAVCVEHTRSVASGDKDGNVHVWRVELQGNASTPSTVRVLQSPVSSYSVSEGPVLALQHYNTDNASLVVAATPQGVRGWDLRCAEPVFSFPLRPELGPVTAMTVSGDRQWVALGTSRGYLALWDVRYGAMTSLWAHSSGSAIHRLACCKSFKSPSESAGLGSTEGGYIFVAAGTNEAAVWGLPEGGDCYKCFRSVLLNDCKSGVAQAPLPVLKPLPLPSHPFKPLPIGLVQPFYGGKDSASPSVRAMLGRISINSPSYLITAGSDRHIRYWDFRAPEQCYTVAGLEATQSKSLFATPKIGNNDASPGRLFVCYVSSLPSAQTLMQTHQPVRELRGLVAPSVNCRDGVTDLKDLEVPMRMLISASRDGEIKLWR
eukprot:gene672-726_t